MTTYIDTRDLYAEREELVSPYDDGTDEHDAWSNGYFAGAAGVTCANDSFLDPEVLGWDAGARYRQITDLFEELEDYAGDRPEDGVLLIPDDEFIDYAMELADDIGAIDSNFTWPLTCIDWKQAASELQMDYTTVEFDGTTYWYR